MPKTAAPKKRKRRPNPADTLPAVTDWRTTDQQEVIKRKLRGREETFRFINVTPEHPIFSNFEIHSPSGMTYYAELRDIPTRQFSCTCTDFRINGLGTCKHLEALLLHLARRERAHFKAAQRVTSLRADIVPDIGAGCLRVERNAEALTPKLRALFDADGLARPSVEPEEILAIAAKASSGSVRVSQDVMPWMEARAREHDRLLARRDYETGVSAGRHPEHVTLSPLFPYQREGMLHLAFKERALLADEMGLGKTIQAIAACALLHHLGRASRVLVVTPASLKAEWEEQIARFTTLSQRLVFGGRAVRAQFYSAPAPPFFTIANYEQIVPDSLDINNRLAPDIVVLDEAQRIKNWSTKTAQAVKRLQSRYAFVLTGTPIENRIDEIRSLVDFLDPALLGPLFRFNREYYVMDERGRPEGYKNLDRLRERIRPVLLRRRKADVETELPDRTDRNHFVQLTPQMRSEYAGYEKQVAELVMIAKRRPLTSKEQDILMVLLNILRMICDSPGIMKDNPSRECPKLDEIARILDELLADQDVKIIIFSEWIGMLARVREWADANEVGYAWHTGSIPQQRRRAEIITFRNDPACRIFLSTDSGGVGLNLQNASVVINCDLPWNPAKLEQRIARAWRKGQRRPVTVLNLIAENTIEHGMLESLGQKMRLSEGVLDGGDTTNIRLKSGGQALLKRLDQIMSSIPSGAASPPLPARVADPAAAFAARSRELLGGQFAYCEETWMPGSDTPVIIAVLSEGAVARRPAVEELFADAGWSGSPLLLQVLDATAWDALKTLAAAGMITIHTRAARPLLPMDGQPPSPPISAEQLAKMAELRALIDKKRRAAAALKAVGLEDETGPLKEAAETAEAELATMQPATQGM